MRNPTFLWGSVFTTPFLLPRAMRGFYFLRLRMNFLDLVSATYFLVRCLLQIWLNCKRKRANWFEVLFEINIRSSLSIARQWILQIGYIQKETFFVRALIINILVILVLTGGSHGKEKKERIVTGCKESLIKMKEWKSDLKVQNKLPFLKIALSP